MTGSIESSFHAARTRSPLVRYAVAAAIAWVLVGALGALLCRQELVEIWQGPKFCSPVVVIQSDDWGAGDWLGDSNNGGGALDARQTAGVEQVCNLLRRHADSCGRHPIFSAFLVVGQPDVPAVLADKAGGYHWLPIDRAMPRLVQALKKAAAEGLFDLEYHGVQHRNPRVWTEALRKAVAANLRQGKDVSPELLDSIWPEATEPRDAMCAEYLETQGNQLVPMDPQEVEERVRRGVETFQRVFGKRPLCTQAPRHLWGPQAEEVWARNGFRYLFGINYQRGPFGEGIDKRSRCLGYRTPSGLVGVPRTDAVDSLEEQLLPTVDAFLAKARETVAAGGPIVLATHSYNYYPPDPAQSEVLLKRLDEILTAMEREFPDLRYLSAEEIGRIGEEGRHPVALPPGPGPSIAADGTWQHAWIAAKAVYLTRMKARLWIWGLAVIAVALAALAAYQGARHRGKVGQGL